ncbi:MAG: glycoside hydrolase family 113 [Planctomycetota bacterium]|jgi:hypothetical protein
MQRPVHTTSPGPEMLRFAFVAATGLAAALAADRPLTAVPRAGHVAEIPDDAAATASPALLGFAVNAHHISDLSLYLDAVDAIADLGATGLVVVSPMFQQRADSSEIRYVDRRCPTDEQLTAILRRARGRGLHTTLLPIVLLEDAGTDDWRGVIRPADPETWWASYDQFLDRFLDIAVTAEVDAFSVGSELNSMESEVDRWRRVIARARGRFGGTLTYTANWDRYRVVPFWSLLDLISVSAYFELAPQDAQASPEQLARAWRSERDRLLGFARSHRRPLVLMEVGYPSVPWAAAKPWNYVPRDGVTADHDAQARCYRALFDAWAPVIARGTGPARGLHCYCWDPYHHGGAADTGYGVAGKPALEVIRDAFARIRYPNVPDGPWRGR